ncbi:hypothetical protein V1499_01755 [Neobacillus sp. SCS-31]|uniref:hypothetical protein n=1 Tax=Neobacillus oceani TaxID=3115292 RepID=UPI003906A4CE
MTRYNKMGLVGEVSLLRLYLLRGLYLLVVVGLGFTVWPDFINRSESWELMEGVVQCMLVAFWALSVLGLRYPLQMLPVLLWELVWKSVWLIIVALPMWISGHMDNSTLETAIACLLVVIFPFVIPWRFVFINYAKKRGDRWG